MLQDLCCFCVALFLPLLQESIFSGSKILGKQYRLSGKIDCDQMEHLEGEQYSQYTMEGNPSAYMSMRDYINQSWQSQQPVERNPSEYRSMRDYRDQWMSSPYGSTYNHSWGNHTNSSWEPKPPQYAPPEPLYYASIPQPQQSPQLISPVEQAILNLSKIVDNFIEEQRAVTVQANQETNTIENSLNQELDVFQSKIDQEFDILQPSISHQEEENLEEECLTDTIVGEQAQLQLQEELKEEPAEDPPEELQVAPQLCVEYEPWKKEEETSPMLTEEGNGEEEMEEPHQFTAKATNNPLPAAPPDSVFILPMPAAQPNRETPTMKATLSLPMLKKFKRLVAIVQNFATTSNKMAAAHTAWHSGWFGFGAPEPRHL